MSRLQRAIAALAGVAAALALVLPLGTAGEATLWAADRPAAALFAVLGTAGLLRFRRPLPLWADGLLMLAGWAGLAAALPGLGAGGPGFWALAASPWLHAWLTAERLSTLPAAARGHRGVGLLVPALFGVTLLVLCEAVTRGLPVPHVLLPPPSLIGATIAGSVPVLWADFQQTFLKAVLIGWAAGSCAGLAAAIAIDRSPFLQRGLLPVGNLVSALPIVGIAPIMVMWFGFDWPSKAAVVVVMTFFPMLVNAVAGLAATGRIERDLMRTYAAGYWQALWRLRLPAAAPFIFNALKINSTLALIGAIVAEFFGTPIVGMGFRISTEVGRMNVEMAWAEIAVAAVAGSAFFGAVVLVERAVTFWHPSVRR